MRPRSYAGALSLLLLACTTSPVEEDPVFGGSEAAAISAEQTEQWTRAYEWGDHSAANYLTTEADPVFAAAPAASITAEDLVRWNATADASANHLTAETDPLFALSPAALVATEDLARWNAASGWGDHAAAGYLTTELDPQFSGSAAAGISSAQIASWNAAAAWGDHASAGYLTTEADPAYAASPAATIAEVDLQHWDDAYGWGNHASAGYLQSEQDPQVSIATVHAVPRWNGTSLVEGLVRDTGVYVGIGTDAPTALLAVHGGTGTMVRDQAQQSVSAYYPLAFPFEQTVTAGMDGQWAAFEYLRRYPSLNRVGVELLDLAGTTVLATSLCPSSLEGWVSCRFNSAPRAVAGTTYLIRITLLSGTDEWLGVQNGNPYPGGGLTFAPSEFDLAFRTHLYPGEGPVLEVGASVNIKTVLNLMPLDAPPSSAQAGDLYFDNTSKRLRFFNGTSWVTL